MQSKSISRRLQTFADACRAVAISRRLQPSCNSLQTLAEGCRAVCVDPAKVNLYPDGCRAVCRFNSLQTLAGLFVPSRRLQPSCNSLQTFADACRAVAVCLLLFFCCYIQKVADACRMVAGLFVVSCNIKAFQQLADACRAVAVAVCTVATIQKVADACRAVCVDPAGLFVCIMKRRRRKQSKSISRRLQPFCRMVADACRAVAISRRLQQPCKVITDVCRAVCVCSVAVIPATACRRLQDGCNSPAAYPGTLYNIYIRYTRYRKLEILEIFPFFALYAL